MKRFAVRVWLPVFFLFAASPLFAASYTASTSGNWSSASTWGGAGVPGSGDSATISGGQTVTLDVAVTVANLTLSSGTLTGTQSLNVTTAFNWNGGTHSGSGTTTIPSGSIMTVGGGGELLDGRPLSVAGALNITGSNYFYMQSNAVLTNSGTVTFAADGNLYLNGTAGSTAISNSGTIQKTGGTSGSSITVPLIANSGSQVVTQSSILYLADIASTGGTFSVGSGATLNFNTSSTRNFDATSTISGAGTVQWANGTNNVHGTYNVTGTTVASGGTTTVDAPTSAGSVTMSGGVLQLDGATTLTVPTLTMTSGTLKGAAPINLTASSMTWSGGQIYGSGTITIPSGTTVTAGNVILDERPIVNNGGFDLLNSYVYLENNAVLTNNGTIDYQGDGNLYLNGTAGTTAVVNNGTIQKSAGTSSVLTVALTANSGSQLLAQSGTLYVAQVTSTGASFGVSSGATLNFYYANTRTFDSASAISGAGTVEWGGGTNTVSASYNVTGTTKSSGAITTLSNITSTGNLTLTGGVLTLNSASTLTVPALSSTGGTLAGTAPISLTALAMTWSNLTLSGSGTLTIPAGSVVSVAACIVDGRPLTNNGSIVLSTSYVYLQNNAVLTNNGTIDYQGDANIYLNGTAGTTAVVNAGTIQKSAGTSGSNLTVPLTMQSGSQLLVQSGPLYVGQVVSTGATFNVSGGATLSFYYSNTRSFDAASTISGAGTVDFPGGTNTVSAVYNVTGITKNSGGTTTLSNITSTSDVVVTGGTLTLNSASALAMATLTLSGGTLAGTAPINVSAAAMTWSSAALSGSGAITIPNGTTVTMTYCTLDGRPLTNNGVIDITGTAYCYVQNNAVFTNNGIVDLQGDANLYLNGTAGTTSFVNNGTVKKSAGTSGSNFTVPLAAQSGSQFLVQSGPMYVGQVTSTGAAFSVSGGATLAFYYSNTRTFDAASTISGAGDVEWDNGTNTVSATYNVTGKTKNAGATTTLSNIAGLGDLASTSGTLTLNSGSALSVGVLTITGGTINGTAPITITGTAMTWASGTFGGSGLLTIPAGTTVTVNGGYPIFDARPVTSSGTINVQSFYNLYLQNNAVFTNNGTIDLQGDGSLYLNSAVGTTSIVNNGTIKKSGGTGTSVLNVPLTGSSGSQLQVQSGILDVGAVTSTGAAFTVSTGATLNFYYSEVRTFDAATTISGAGTVGWLSGTNTFSGTMSTPLNLTGGTLTVNSASAQSIPTLTLSGGTLNGTGNVNLTGAAMTWTGGTLGGSGTLSIPAGTVITVSGYPILDGKPVNNAGTINLTTTNYVYFQNNAILTNSGTIDLQSDGSLYLNSVAGTTALVNSGIVKKSGGSGTSTITAPLTMQSGGQFLLQSGTVTMGAVASTGGAFSLSSGTTLNFNTSDTRTFDAATTISGAGTAQWQGGTSTFTGTLTTPVTMTGGTLTIDSASAQTFPKLTISGGTFTGTAAINFTAPSMVWSGGTFSGSGTITIPAGTSVNISGYPTFDGRQVTNNGSIAFTANNYAYLQNNAIVTNNGTIDFQSDANLYLSGAAGSTSVVNNGTFKKSAGTASGTAVTVPIVAQSGSQFQVQSGTVYVDAITSTGGAFSISSGATLNFYYSATRTFDAASSITGVGTLVSGNGTNTISGTISVPITENGGTLNVNSVAPQTVTTLNLNGGVFGGSGTVNVTGTSMTWGGPTINGSGTLAIAAGTTVNITGYPTIDTHAINNAGTITFGSGTYGYLQNNAVLTNSGTIDFQTDGSGLYLNGAAGTTSIVNNGTIRKSGATGSSTLSVPLTAGSGSQLLAQSGTLYLADIAATGATFNASSGAFLVFNYSSTRTFDAASTLSGAGSFLWQSGTNTVSGTISAPTTVSGGTLAINSGSAQSLASLTLSGGTLNGTAALNITGASTWTGGTIGGSGTLTIPPTTTLTISGYPFIDTRPVVNNGTIAFTSSFYTYLQNGAALTNNGTIDFQGDSAIYLNTGAASITNNGTIQKSAGAGTSTLGVPVTNASAGTLKSASGILSLTQGLTNSGTLAFPIAGAATFGKINVNGAFALAGTLTVTTTGGYTPTNGTVFQILTYGSYSGAFSGKNLDYSGGSFTESYAPASLSVTAGPQALGISGLTPARGTSAGGTSVTITGSDFDPGATVTFGGLPVTSMSFANSTSITVVTPAHAPGPVDVVVTNPSAQSATATNAYTYTGLVAHYSFDVAGTPGKDVANGNDATNVTGVTQTAGKVGQGGSFVSGYMDLPAPASLNLRGSDFTLEAWVSSSSTTNANWLTKATASTQQYGLGTAGSTKAAFSFDNAAGGSVVSTTNVFDGTWHHVAGVKRGSTIEIWVDGQLQASGPVTGSSDAGNFAVGRNGACCESFDGLIDEAKIYNYALTSTEIQTDALAADLALGKTAPSSVTAGQTFTYAVAVVNAGPNAATGVTITDPLPLGVAFVSATSSQGTCSGTSTVTCSIGSLASGANASVTITVTATSAGTFTNTATVSGIESDPNAANNSASASTTINPSSCATPTVTASGPTTFCAGGNVTLTANASGAIAYQWYLGVNPIGGATGVSYVATASGNYSVKATYANACSATSAAVPVVVNPAPATPTVTASGPTTFCAGGSVTLTSSAGSSWFWSNGATTQSINVTTSGNYTVTITDGSGCTATSAPMAVTANPLPNATISAPASACANVSTSASVPANANATFSWTATNAVISNGATSNVVNFTPNGSGNVVLNVTITDNNGCTAGNTATVNVGAFSPTITASGPASFCTGGSVTLTASSGTGYLWSTGATTQSIVVSTSGNYSVTVTSGAGCSGTSAPFTVTVYPPPSATVTSSGGTTFCAGGSVTLTASAGASWLWSTGATTQSIVVSTSGSYSVTVTSAQGCATTSAPTAVNVVSAPAPVISGPSSTCPGGSVTLDAGAGFASYSWSTGETTQTITVSPASTTTYNVTVTSGANCTGTASKTVTVSGATTPAITAPATVCANSSGNAASTPIVAGASYTWTISGGAITSGTGTNAITFTAGPSGAVQLGLTVTSGTCSGSATKTVSVTAAPTPAITAPPAVCASSSGNTASTTAIAGATYTWTISGGAITSGAGTSTVTFNAAASGNVQLGLTVTLSGGCSGTASKSVPIMSLGSVTITAPSSVAANSTGNTASVPAGPAGSSYNWTINGGTIATGQGTRSIVWSAGPSGPISIAVTVTSGACTSSGSASVSVVASCNHASPSLLAPPNTTIATSPVTFQWSIVNEATSYRVWLSIDGGAAQDVGTTASNALTLPLSGKSFAWFVEALFNGCPSTVSPTQTFTMISQSPCSGHGTATPVAPADKSASTSSAIQFQWTSVAQASGYRLWASVDGGDFNALGTTTTETTLNATIPTGTVVWYVQTLFDGCPATESAHVTFTIPKAQSCPTAPATLATPAANATLHSTSVTFSWNAAPSAIGYELFVALNNAAPSSLGTTTSTTLTRDVPPGVLEWFVRTSFNGCPPLDSAHAVFAVSLPPNCSTQHTLLVEPADGDNVVSPVGFQWSAVPQATQYKLWIARNGGTPQLAATTADVHAGPQTLQPGAYEWTVETIFPNGCASTQSAAGSFTVVAPPPVCAPAVAPLVRANGQVSSNVEYTISWTRIGNAASYEVQEARLADFTDAASQTTTSDRLTFQHANTTLAPVVFFYRVRMISQCDGSKGPFSQAAAVVILPAQSATPSQLTGATPADDPQPVSYTIVLGGDAPGAIPAQPGQTFSAVPNQPWISVTPSSGTVAAGGTTLTVTANTAGLPIGTSTGALTILLGTATSASRIAPNGGTTTTTATVNVNLVQPMSPTTKNAPPPDALIIPAVAHADGINSKFQSDIRVTNTAAQVQKYKITFTPSGDAGSQNGKQTTVSIDPGATLALDDILNSWFGVGASAQGAIGTLEIRPQSSSTATSPTASSGGVPSITTFAASRTYNTTANGTYGQYIPAIPFAQFIAAAQSGKTPSVLTLQQIAQSDAYRTNFGLVEGSGDPASVLVSIFGDDGAKLGEFTQALAGGQHLQLNGMLAAQHLSVNDGRIEVKVLSGGGKVTAYASVVDNATNDPLLVSPVQLGGLGAAKWVIPGVADLNNGIANWRSDVRLYNAGGSAVDVTLTYVPQNGGDPVVKTLSVGANQVQQLDGILQSLFGITNSGGALHITTASSAPLVATARTYNQTANGTYGQFIPAVTPFDAVGKGQRALQILQVEESDRYRSNVGIAEVTGKPATVEITAVPADSKFAATTTATLNPNEYRQYGSLLRSMGFGDTYNARVTVRVIDGDGKVTAYASVIDQRTQDPTFVPAQ